MYSVIIPSYNRCYVLPQAIDSVLLQNYPALEIIVIDDGSNDDTAQMMAQKYPNVRYLYQENQGPAAARNRGIQAAKGNIIAFLDSDDIWLAGKIALEQRLFRDFPNADMLAGNATTFLLGQLHVADTFAQRQIDFQQQRSRFFDWTINIMERGPVCLTSAMTFKRSTLDKLDGKPFDESLRLDEDWDLEFRLFSQSKALLYPQIRCHRRISDDGTRHFYSIQGQKKSPQEQLQINQQQQQIIGRYLDNIVWNSATRQRFQQRHQQLNH
ncbi:MAG: glycosyltransferase family 2 protein [Gammaproteobacteria bacterium]|nr:glycosyltransferase family 2 protein [Gammaproteobacteria bacterium]